MSSDSKVTIDALEGKGVHWEVSARWQDFSFSEVTEALSIKGKSPEDIYNHSYLVEISE